MLNVSCNLCTCPCQCRVMWMFLGVKARLCRRFRIPCKSCRFDKLLSQIPAEKASDLYQHLSACYDYTIILIHWHYLPDKINQYNNRRYQTDLNFSVNNHLLMLSFLLSSGCRKLQDNVIQSQQWIKHLNSVHGIYHKQKKGKWKWRHYSLNS